MGRDVCMEIDEYEMKTENEKSRCLICNTRCKLVSGSLTNSDAKLAFGLFCKLLLGHMRLENDVGGELASLCKLVDDVVSSSGDNDSVNFSCKLFGGEEDEGTLVSFCELCSGALREILRLDRIIRDLKVSQMVHVKAMQKSLLKLDHGNERIQDCFGNTNFLKSARRQLIACLNGGTLSKPSSSSSSLVKTMKSQQRMPRNGSLQFQNEQANDSFIPSLTRYQLALSLIKPCSVRLTRLNLEKCNLQGVSPVNDIISSTPPSNLVSSSSRPVRKSKLRAYDVLKKSLSVGLRADDTDSESESDASEKKPSEKFRVKSKAKRFLPCQDDDYFQDEDNSLGGDPDFYPSPEHIIKEEADDYEYDSISESDRIEMCFFDDDEQELNVEVNKEDKRVKPSLSRKTTECNEKRRRCKRVQLIASNVYMLGCTVINFDPEERIFVCQEPGCSAIIPGTMLDGSILKNIRAHVQRKHSIKTVVDGKVRTCPICSAKLKDSPMKFRKHILTHIGAGRFDSKNRAVVVCEDCGKPSIVAYDSWHKWSHRNFQDKVTAVEAGEKFPSKYKEKIKGSPLYSIIMKVEKSQRLAKKNKNKKSRASVTPGSKPRSSIPQLKKTSLYSILYKLQENKYFYRHTCFEYSPAKRIFRCLETDCSVKIAEWKNDVICQIKMHVENEHYWSYQPEDRRVRKCCICSETVVGLHHFRTHVIKSHGEFSGKRTSSSKKTCTICEICSKPLTVSLYLSHIWTHKSDEDALNAIRSGEPIATDWKKSLLIRKREPLYSLVFNNLEEADGDESENLAIDQVTEEENEVIDDVDLEDVDYSTDVVTEDIMVGLGEKANETVHTNEMFPESSTVPCIKRHIPLKHAIYVLEENFYLFKSTLFKFSPVECHFVCLEPGCSALVNGSFLDSSITQNIYSHVQSQHEHSTKLQLDGRIYTCPICSYTIIESSIDFRTHLISTHSKYEEQEGLCTMLCKICAKPCCEKNYLLHMWSHKNYDDKVAHIEGGGVVPLAVRKALKFQLDDPLHPLLYGRRRGKQPNRTMNEKQEEEASASGVCLKQRTSRLNIVYILPENYYLLKYTVFKYCVLTRLFLCQEPDCSASIPEWDTNAVLKMKMHVNKEHAYESHFLLYGLHRDCPICGLDFSGPMNFRKHLLQNHIERITKCGPAPALCEICLKPVTSKLYLMHIWTHKSDEDALVSIEAGEPVSSDWKRALQTRTESPLYSLLMSEIKCRDVPDTTSQNIPLEKRKRSENFFDNYVETTLKHRKKRCRIDPPDNSFYYVNDSTILFKCTLMTVENNFAKLICQEPGCNLAFQEDSPMNYFGLSEQVKLHVNAEHEEYYWNLGTGPSRKCPLCDAVFRSAYSFRVHFFDSHCTRSEDRIKKGIGRVICESCSQPFNPKYVRPSDHAWTHKSPEEQVVNKCSVNYLHKHVIVNPTCETCGRMFSSLERLKAHSKVHIDYAARRKYECTYCNKQFLAPVAVRNHIERIHRRDLIKFVKCPEPGCNKVFNRRDGTRLRGHLNMHRGERPFVCDMCGKAFHSNTHYQKHREQVHHGSYKYQCDECGMNYKSIHHLRRHKKNTHNK